MNQDRLTNLPEELLSNILPYLDRQEIIDLIVNKTILKISRASIFMTQQRLRSLYMDYYYNLARMKTDKFLFDDRGNIMVLNEKSCDKIRDLMIDNQNLFKDAFKRLDVNIDSKTRSVEIPNWFTIMTDSEIITGMISLGLSTISIFPVHFMTLNIENVRGCIVLCANYAKAHLSFIKFLIIENIPNQILRNAIINYRKEREWDCSEKQIDFEMAIVIQGIMIYSGLEMSVEMF